MNVFSQVALAFQRHWKDGGRMKFNRIALYTTLFTILCLGGSLKAWAEDDEMETYGQAPTHDFVKHRAYLGFYGTSTIIDSSGDFNGFEAYHLQTSPTSNIESNSIPTIDRQFGFAGMAGYREGAWAGEVSYWYTNHNAYIYSGVDVNNNPVTSLATTAVYSSINLDLKRYFFTTLPIQPFLLAGVNFAFLSSHHTSQLLDPTGTTVFWSGNQTESGVGLNLGVGLELYLGDGLSLVGGAVQRFTSWAGESGASKVDSTPMPSGDPSNTGALEGNGLNFFVGATVGIE
jgi:hypothetical protein